MENKFRVGDRVTVSGSGWEIFTDTYVEMYRSKATVTRNSLEDNYSWYNVVLDSNEKEIVVHERQLHKLKKRLKIVRYIYKSPDGKLGDVAWEGAERPQLDRDWKWIKLEEVRE